MNDILRKRRFLLGAPTRNKISSFGITKTPPEYYAAINASNDAGESTVFIEFMLSTIKASLIDAINTSGEMSDEPMEKATMRWKQIEKFLDAHPYIMNADVRALCGVSAATANRFLQVLLSRENLSSIVKVDIGRIDQIGKILNAME